MMRMGVLLRNMGAQSAPDLLRACARRAEAAGLDDLWVVDHIAIPPEDAEGSGGRYLDPLATLAHLAGVTTRIGLGVTVLIAPYRPPLPRRLQIVRWFRGLVQRIAQRIAGGGCLALPAQSQCPALWLLRVISQVLLWLVEYYIRHPSWWPPVPSVSAQIPRPLQ